MFFMCWNFFIIIVKIIIGEKFGELHFCFGSNFKIFEIVVNIENQIGIFKVQSSRWGFITPVLNISYFSDSFWTSLFVHRRERYRTSEILRNENEEFICPRCSKTFRVMSSLRTHLSQDCIKITFHCHYCPFTCYRKYNLKKHISRRHEENNRNMMTQRLAF